MFTTIGPRLSSFTGTLRRHERVSKRLRTRSGTFADGFVDDLVVHFQVATLSFKESLPYNDQFARRAIAPCSSVGIDTGLIEPRSSPTRTSLHRNHSSTYKSQPQSRSSLEYVWISHLSLPTRLFKRDSLRSRLSHSSTPPPPPRSRERRSQTQCTGTPARGAAPDHQ